MGVIVLERVSVDRIQNDAKPYTFMLNFEGDDSRSYFLTAYSEAELTDWMQAIRMARSCSGLLIRTALHHHVCCSYEGLKSMLYKLQNRLTSLTGEDPLKDKHVSFIGPQVSSHKISRQLHDGMKALYCKIYFLFFCCSKAITVHQKL